MTIGIMLADKCNLQCQMCSFVQNATGQTMPFDQYLDILEQCKKARVLGRNIDGVRLDGNREPLLYPQLEQAIVESKQRGFLTRFVTNGVLLDAERSEQYLRAGLDSIQISVTGTVPEVYAQFQGYGRSVEQAKRQMERVIENVKGFIALKRALDDRTTVVLSYLLSEASVAHARKDIVFWKSLGVDYVHVWSVFDNVWEATDGYSQKNQPWNCINSLIIGVNGEVFPCCHDTAESFSLGNCFKTPLHEILRSDQYRHFLSCLNRHKGLPLCCRQCYYMNS